MLKHLIPGPDKRYAPLPCVACPLGGTRRVGSRGTVDSPLVIILEAPGTEELKYGAPICGPSGELIDKLVPPDFDFDEAYIINAMQCRPPKTADKIKDKEFKARACAACRMRVLDQVFLHPRKAVLAMGAWSNTSLTADYNYKITQRRGEVYAVAHPNTGDEVIVVPTVHPAYLLRGNGNAKVFQDDMSLAIGLAFDGASPVVREHNWEDPNNLVVDSLSGLIKFRQKLEKESRRKNIQVAADIETSGLDHVQDYILCVGFYQTDKHDCAVIIPGECLSDGAFRWHLRRILKLPKVEYVWQFGKFDEKFLCKAKVLHPEDCALDEDVGLMSYSLNEASKDHDLDEQAKNDLGAPNHKDMLKQWVPTKNHSYALVPRPVLYDYLAKDLKKTLLVHHHKRPLVAADVHLEKLYTRTLKPASHLLAEIEQYGIQVDLNYVALNRQELETEKVQIEIDLSNLVGYTVNPNSPDEVSTLLYDTYGLRIKNKRPEGTAKEILEKLPPHPAVKLIRKYRSTSKMLSTYVAAIEKRNINSRIHTSFKLHATTTGRLSSSEPNIQNIPREGRYRRMYCARPGCVLVEADYNSAELRMLAALSGDVFLTSVFMDDTRNLHDEVSVAMYGTDFNQDQRIRAKAINFGIPYGREAGSVAEEFDISTSEAQRLIDAWFARAPQAAAFLNLQARAPLQGRTLVTVFGRKRRPGVVSPERLHSLQNEFRNFHMQSPISDFTIHAGIRMQPRLRKEGASLVNLIHDADLVECPNDSQERVQQVAGIMKETMESVPREWITTPIQFRVDLKVGTHWGMLKKYELTT